MLNLEKIKKFSMIPGVEPEPEPGITNGIKWHISMMPYEKNIFSEFNDLYRKNKDSWEILMNSSFYEHMTNYSNHNVFLCLIEINKLINQIKLDLEMVIKQDELNMSDIKLYYSSYFDKYYYSGCISKVYFDILFKNNYIYKLFDPCNEVNLWKLNSMITINELITLLTNKSNDLCVKQIDNIDIL